MKIENDRKFAELTTLFSTYDGLLNIAGATELDLLDYHWFLVSVLDGIEKQYTLELMENFGDFNAERYIILQGEINDEKLNEITLKLKKIEDNSISEYSFEIESVRDARVLNAMKYYVNTKNGGYRFLILGMS